MTPTAFFLFSFSLVSHLILSETEPLFPKKISEAVPERFRRHIPARVRECAGEDKGLCGPTYVPKGGYQCDRFADSAVIQVARWLIGDPERRITFLFPTLTRWTPEVIIR